MRSKAWIAILATAGMLGAGHTYAASYYYDETAVDNQSVNAPYRFDYVVSGPSAARPKQVYSDGYETFLEFPAGVRPTYFLIDGEKVKPKFAKPYYVLSGEYAGFKVRTTRGEIEVERRANSQVASSISSRYPAPPPKKTISEEDLAAAFTPAPAVAAQGAAGAVDAATELAERKVLTLPAGQKLSEALADYVKAHDWDLKWMIDHDYYIEAPIPMNEDFFGAIYDLVKTYQAQGGMQGVIPRFAASNRVVSIEYLDHTNR